MTDKGFKAEPAHINFSSLSFISLAKNFSKAALIVIAHEGQDEENGWHPVGKYLACHGIELALKAFLLLRGMEMKKVEGYRHDLVELLTEIQKRNLEEFVQLTGQEFAEIEKASKHYYGNQDSDRWSASGASSRF